MTTPSATSGTASAAILANNLIGRGLSNVEIAQRLFVGEGTVKTHIGRIFTKLQTRDRTAAVVFAFDHGVVHPGSPHLPTV
jgi:DNA-binding NarL/FixJ family response regulator